MTTPPPNGTATDADRARIARDASSGMILGAMVLAGMALLGCAKLTGSGTIGLVGFCIVLLLSPPAIFFSLRSAAAAIRLGVRCPRRVALGAVVGSGGLVTVVAIVRAVITAFGDSFA